MKMSYLIAMILTSVSFSALAVGKIEHTNCKVNYLNLSNGEQFGFQGAFTEFENEDTQKIIKLLGSKGYLIDRSAVVENYSDQTGLAVHIRTHLIDRSQVQLRDGVLGKMDKTIHETGKFFGNLTHEISYSIVADNAEVTYIKSRRNYEEKLTISARELAAGSKTFLKLSTAKKKDFVLNFAQEIPECVINPDVKLDIVIRR